MLEILQTAGKVLLAIGGAVVLYFVAVFLFKNFGKIFRVVLIMGVILFAAIALGSYVGGLIDEQLDREIFTYCGAAVLGVPALIFGTRFVVDRFIKGKEWFDD